MDRAIGQWPELPLEAWHETYATLHLWTQIVGKVRLTCTPWVNHSWHVTLYVTTRGLATMPIPHGARSFSIDFDFIDHLLHIQASDGSSRSLPLKPKSVAAFYQELLGELADLGLAVSIHGRPNEVAHPTPFAKDREHAAYDPEYAQRLWRVLVQVERVLQAFRSGFIGKCSPVQFYWGSFDLAVSRFSGRPAPLHPGGTPNLPDRITQEAYSQEVSSCGFWPGGGPYPFPLFYSYAYPEPEGFQASNPGPEGAFYSSALREFILPYDVVRQSAAPDRVLYEFLASTYVAAARLGKWDRTKLEAAGGQRA